MTLTDLHSLVPAAFATQPDPRVSRVYEFVPTLPIVQELLDRGWQIRSAHQNSKWHDPHASHRIVFDVPGTPLTKEVGDVWPTATLYNSHNRTRRVSFSMGFYRTVCKNQAQISVLSLDLQKIHIVGWGGIDIYYLINDVVNELGALPTLINRMKEVTFNAKQQLQFGKSALSIRRYGTTKNHVLYTDSDAAIVLTPQRGEDRGVDLWRTYNRVQENILHGSSHGINEVGQNRKINLGLWQLAQAYLNN